MYQRNGTLSGTSADERRAVSFGKSGYVGQCGGVFGLRNRKSCLLGLWRARDLESLSGA